MSLQTCVPRQFVSTLQQGINWSQSLIRVSRIIKGVTPYWRLAVSKRPSAPMYGVTIDVNGVTKFLVSTVANRYTILRIAESCLAASKNYVTNNIAGTAQYIVDENSGNYGSYLYYRVGDAQPNIDRYNAMYSQIVNFYDVFAIAAYNSSALSNIERYLLQPFREVDDKSMLIAPGYYDFDEATDPAGIALAAWSAADPTLQGFYSYEAIVT